MRGGGGTLTWAQTAPRECLSCAELSRFGHVPSAEVCTDQGAEEGPQRSGEPTCPLHGPCPLDPADVSRRRGRTAGPALLAEHRPLGSWDLSLLPAMKPLPWAPQQPQSGSYQPPGVTPSHLCTRLTSSSYLCPTFPFLSDHRPWPWRARWKPGSHSYGVLRDSAWTGHLTGSTSSPGPEKSSPLCLVSALHPCVPTGDFLGPPTGLRHPV